MNVLGTAISEFLIIFWIDVLRELTSVVRHSNIDPLFIIGLFFTTKSLLVFGKPVFRRDQHLCKRIISTFLVILDTNRSSMVLLCLVRGLQCMRSIGNMKWILSVLLLIPIATEVAVHTFFFTYADKVGDKRIRQTAIIFEVISVFLLLGTYMLFHSIH